ncbi:DUF5701 family protein [Demequina globuliformis]|uniref:DUF5701 family protein n=1 Tax=Demequina globuliformis TaxID=676202 RepID=UPI000784F861|nr:DUF5701 family protein [Demequina globuliformis]
MTSLLLDDQVDAYITAGLHRLAALSEGDFREVFDPLRGAAAELPQDAFPADGVLPYVAVVADALIDPAARVPGLRLPGSANEGILDRNHGEEGLAPYRDRPELEVPQAPAYLLVNVQRGDEFRDVAPLDACAQIADRGRSPLTIAEGLSITAAHPGFLKKNHCFMLAGSSRGDKRVPAIWISQKAPKLGWCFDKVPHSWLGIASAAARRPVSA